MGHQRRGTLKAGHESCKMVPADGGWGWFILAGAVTISICAPSIVGCFGIILPSVRKNMNTSVASTAWISSLAQALNFLSSPVTAMLAFAYSFRKTAFVGGVLISLGMCLTRFVNRIEFMYITIGVMGGLGFGLSVKASLFVVNQYFDKRRGLATGAHYSGAAVSRLIFPVIIQSLLDEYGYSGTILIWGAILAHILVAASLFQPPEWHRIHVPGPHCIDNLNVPEANDDDSHDYNKNSVNEDSVQDPPYVMCINNIHTKSDLPVATKEEMKNFVNVAADKMNRLPINDIYIQSAKKDLVVQKMNNPTPEEEKTFLGESKNKYSGHRTMSASSIAQLESCLDIPGIDSECDECKNSINADEKKSGCFGGRVKNLTKQLDYSILREYRFYVVACSGICNSFATVNAFIFIPPLGQDKGLSSSQAAWLLSSVGIGEIFGRFILPWLQDLGLIRAKYAYMAGAFVSSIIAVALTFPETYIIMVVLCITLGVSSGSMTGLNACLNVEAVGAHRLASSLSFAQVGQGILILPSGPILGAIRDATQNYDRCFYVIGAVYLCAFFIWTFEIILSLRHNNKTKKNSVQTWDN